MSIPEHRGKSRWALLVSILLLVCTDGFYTPTSHHRLPPLGYGEGMEQEEKEIRPRPWMDPPTETAFDGLGPKSIPSRPKIVVLGATGRIGRQVVRQLLEMKSVDMEIVALVRSYDKAIKVLYEDQFVVAKRSEGRGPKLTIVQGNLVPPEELPGFVQETTEDEILWKETAESASAFYGTKLRDYDNREMLPDVNEALQDAIKDCTTIISCVGSIRRTHLWHDVLARPFVRLLKSDVSSWCKDARHPYYVSYASTRKALGYAEKEQLKREAAATTMAEAEGLDLEEIHVPRIRFVRISDLCVGYNPWDIVPVVANAVHSLVFRYHDMADKLLYDSSLIETIVLRPGDLVDDERDVNTTYIQVSSSGLVPSPAIVGREDVATLAIAASTFVAPNTTKPFHYTFGCRWVGETLESYPPQGTLQDGHSNPIIAFRRSLRAIRRSERASSSVLSKDLVVRMAESVERRKQRRRKPYGICVVLPLYGLLALLAKLVWNQVVPREWALPWVDQAHQRIVQGLLGLCSSILARKPTYIRL